MADTARQQEASQELPEPLALDVNVETPDAVDAASTFTAKVHLTADPITDLRGERFDVLDGDDIVAAGVELIDVDAQGVHTSEPFQLMAPRTLGKHTWTVSLDPEPSERGPYEATKVPFQVEVKAHALRVQTWGAPTAVPAGQPFEVHVGIACSSGCALPGQAFDIVDESGSVQASGSVGKETWKSTKSLYFASVELSAPDGERYAEWRVRTRAADLELAHDDGEGRFGLNAVPAPEHTVRVVAVDKAKGEPIEGMHVWLHPFRAVTDARGAAELAVPEGTYRLYVSGLRYFPHDAQVDIQEDLETTVELTWEVRPEKIR